MWVGVAGFRWSAGDGRSCDGLRVVLRQAQDERVVGVAIRRDRDVWGGLFWWAIESR